MERIPDAPLVSVLIPTFNRAHMLRGAVETVLAQDWPHVELLLLDGGSTDGTPSVLEEFAAAHPERVRPSVHPGLGQIEKLNIGFEQARGDLLITFGDDDRLHAGALARLVEGFRDHPDAIVVYPDYHWIDALDQVVDTMRYPIHNLRDAVRLHICAPAFALFRRELVDEVGGWDPEVGSVADSDFWWRVDRFGEFHHVFETLASLRIHEGTISTSKSLELARQHVRLVDKFYSGPDVPPELLDVRSEAYRNAYITAATTVDEDQNQMEQRYLVEDTLRFIDHAFHYQPTEHDPDPWNSTLRLQAVVRRLLRAGETHEQEVEILRHAIEMRDKAILELRAALAALDESAAQREPGAA